MHQPTREHTSLATWQRALLALAALLGAAGLVMRQGTLDRDLFLAINAQGPQLQMSASALSVLGLGASVFVLAAVVGLRWPRVLAAVVLLLLAGGALIQGIKLSLMAPRPAAVLDPAWVHLTGHAMHGRSMPSGHAAVLAAMASLALLWPWRPPRPRRAHRTLTTALALLALAGGLSRCLVGAHWPSDVLVGAALGMASAALLVGSARGRGLVDQLGTWLHTRVGSRAMVVTLSTVAGVIWVAERHYPLADGLQSALALLAGVCALAWWLREPAPLWSRVIEAAGLAARRP